MPDGVGWVTLAEAAYISGLHPKSLKRLLQKGVLRGHKFRGRWRIGRMDMLRYLETDDIRFGPKHDDAPFRRDEALRMASSRW